MAQRKLKRILKLGHHPSMKATLQSPFGFGASNYYCYNSFVFAAQRAPVGNKKGTGFMSINHSNVPSTSASPASATKLDSPRQARRDKVSLLQTDDYVCIEPSTPLFRAIEVMKGDEGGCAIVCEAGRVLGVFTERDLLMKVVGEEVDMQAPVSGWMSTAVSTLTPDATIGDAVSMMNEKSFRNVPLVKDGQLVGSISVFDVIYYLAESYPKETMNLPPIPDQVMTTEDGG